MSIKCVIMHVRQAQNVSVLFQRYRLFDCTVPFPFALLLSLSFRLLRLNWDTWLKSVCVTVAAALAASSLLRTPG